MSHMRLALGFPRHRKVKRLSNDALCLWVMAMHEAREQGSDGFMDDLELDDVPRCPPRGAKRKALITELVAAKLWDVSGEGWQIHDYTDWQDSSEQVKRRRDAACERARKYRERKALVTHDVTNDITTDVPLDQSTSNSGSKSESAEGSREGNQPPEDPGRETACPMDLLQRLETNGTIARLAEQVPAPIEAVRACVRGFVATWTIGKLAGQRRSGWPGKARQWVIDQHTQGKLLVTASGPGGSVAPSTTSDDEAFLLRARRGEYGRGVVAALEQGAKVQQLREMVRKRAERLTGGSDEPASSPIATDAAPVAQPVLSSLLGGIGRQMP